MSEPTRLKVLRGHLPRDRHGCSFGILDVNPDATDPAAALGIAAPDGRQVGRPIVRSGTEVDCAAATYRAVEIVTGDAAYVVLEQIDDRAEGS